MPTREDRNAVLDDLQPTCVLVRDRTATQPCTDPPQETGAAMQEIVSNSLSTTRNFLQPEKAGPLTLPEENQTIIHKSIPIEPPPIAEDSSNEVVTFRIKGMQVSRESEVVDLIESGSATTAKAKAAFPKIGELFSGFRLIEELGRGAFARVFLAEQIELFDRSVVLKISTCPEQETRTLVQLQHTNIVPIHSAYWVNGFEVICMPFFGRVTLADVQTRWRKHLPETGNELVSSLLGIRSTALQARTSQNQPISANQDADDQPRTVPYRPETTEVLKRLSAMDYVEAILWLFGRLADGLGHAHERGIIHRDLKPANILLTEDGQPMLLDFNTSYDSKRSKDDHEIVMGGTVPYMSPEQFRSVVERAGTVDHRTDLFSLGVILFELLTGQSAYPVRSATSGLELYHLLEDRCKAPPRLRIHNRKISPAVESIVRHCLQPDPNQRYQSVNELKEDIRRHLANLPLKYAPDPSYLERFSKFRRRNPWLSSLTTVSIAAGVMVAFLTTTMVVRQGRLDRLETLEQYNGVMDQKRQVEIALLASGTNYQQIESELLTAQGLLNRYQALHTNRHLNTTEQNQLRQDIGDFAFLLAETETQQARRDGSSQKERLERALELNRLAQEMLGSDQSMALLRNQQIYLRQRLGQDVTGTQRETPQLQDGSGEHYWMARARFLEKKYREAVQFALRATEMEPSSYRAWFVLASSYYELGDDVRAEHCFGTCIALQPEGYRAYYLRGLARHRQHLWDGAINDFSNVLQTKPGLHEARICRALAYQGAGKLQRAIDDLTQALEDGCEQTRVYFLRSRLYKRLGNKEAAQRDFEEGMKTEPSDDISFVARGVARLTNDPNAALKDFEAALKCNPICRSAMQNKSHILAEMGKNQEAIPVQTRLLELYPDYLPARGGRAILYARCGERALALEDAEECMRRDPSANTMYMLAGVYAQTSKQKPEDRIRALQLLNSALSKDVGWDLIEKDHDLDPIRKDPEFAKILERTRKTKPKPTS